MRILILNWRCPRNPHAGGAEAFTFEVARRLVAEGDEVEWFSAAFPSAAADEELDGIRLVRKGRQWTVHWEAYRHYRHSISERFDAVIDEVNTVPFFTPLWCHIPRWMLIFQLAREVWWYESPFPLNALGYATEPQYLKFYRTTPVLTISNSTETDLRRMGFTGPITVLPVGVEPIEEPVRKKQSVPTFVYVGRLVPSKRIVDIVRAFAAFHEAAREGQLWLIGDGSESYVRRLKAEAAALKVIDNVEFFGRVSAGEKHQRMAAAHILLMASVREGWGLATTEAAACGTPSVVYDSPGLRDAVKDGETGRVVSASPGALANAMLQLWNDPSQYQRMAAAATESARRLSFDTTTALFRDAIGLASN
ncbi:MAG TPA: glycosyltransferase family 4 protein [Candidatus Dormibacteraeota bacterium]|nr:glycosyltransferase family 4 protein [Candidatus Dormibacteraeota bacterium]